MLHKEKDGEMEKEGGYMYICVLYIHLYIICESVRLM